MSKLIMFLLITVPINIYSMSREKVQAVLQECGSPQDADQLIATAAKHDRQARHTTSALLPLVAPWRESYKAAERTAVLKKSKECPFCSQFATLEKDPDNFILERNKHSATMFNRNPYLPLHFLILPFRHIAQWDQLTRDERNELLEQVVHWKKKVTELGVSGANFHFNLESKSTGASLPGHVHGQLLSRWRGDRSAITYLLGKTVIAHERKMNSLLPEFYALAQNNQSKKLVKIFGLYTDILAEQDAGTVRTTSDDCYLCDIETDANDEENFIVKRTNNWLVLLHRFGYAAGHLRVVSRRHHTTLDGVNPQEAHELAEIMNCAQMALKKAVSPDGLNMVISEGKGSDAPFDGHITCDVIPRSVNDSPSTAVVCGRSIMEKDVDCLYGVFRKELNEEG